MNATSALGSARCAVRYERLCSVSELVSSSLHSECASRAQHGRLGVKVLPGRGMMASLGSQVGGLSCRASKLPSMSTTSSVH
eukprot:2128997-Amphidinium_carterae.4